MDSEAVPGRLIELASLPNLRDIGGYATRDGGRVRMGRLYRSTELGRLTDQDLETFGRLGIRTVFDLRTEAERQAEPDRLPDGTQLVVCDVLADSRQAAPAELESIVTDPSVADRVLGGGRGVPALQPYFDRFAAAGGDAALLTPVFGVESRYLDAALGELRNRFGTIEDYFAQGLGIDADGQRTLRAIFVE